MISQDALTDYVASLRGASQQDDAAFHLLLVRGMELLQLLDKDIAREFGASRPTVTRWRNGVNAPHPAMRRPVFEWLEKRAKVLLRRLGRTQETQSSSGAAAPISVAARGRDD